MSKKSKQKWKDAFKIAGRAVAAYYTAGASEAYYAKLKSAKAQPAQPILEYAQSIGYGTPQISPPAQGFLPIAGILGAAAAGVALYPAAKEVYRDVVGPGQDPQDEEDYEEEEYEEE